MELTDQCPSSRKTNKRNAKRSKRTIPKNRRPSFERLEVRDLLAAVAPATAANFARAIIMPNLAPPVVTLAQARAYRARIMAALPGASDFEPLMTLYLTEATDPGEVRAGFKGGDIVAAKLYPAGATTNSQSGVRDIEAIYPVLETMAEMAMPLLVHGEVADAAVGVFARGVEDIALLCEPLMRYDARDPDMVPRPRTDLLAAAREAPPLAPNFAFVKSPVWSEASEEGRDAVLELVDLLADACDEVELPPPFEEAVRWHRTILCADLAKSFGRLYEDGKGQLSPVLCEMIEEGQGTLAVDYNRALDMIEVLGAGLERVFERYDAIISPATTGEAPLGLESTGDPVFCTLWTLVGLPALSLPLLAGEIGRAHV